MQSVEPPQPASRRHTTNEMKSHQRRPASRQLYVSDQCAERHGSAQHSGHTLETNRAQIPTFSPSGLMFPLVVSSANVYRPNKSELIAAWAMDAAATVQVLTRHPLACGVLKLYAEGC